MAALRERHGTGVLPAFAGVLFMRGITVGVIGTSSLMIAQRSGLPQNQLVAARGLGLIIGPALFGKAVGKMVWCGESQLGTALLLAAKALCEYIIPRAVSASVLYPAFFFLGLSMTVLDTTKNLLVTRVFGDGCSLPLNLYEVIYGTGAMVAPMVSVAMPNQAWNLLMAIDLSLAAVVAAKRLRRGKPRDWKIKVRGAAIKPVDSGSSPSVEGPKTDAPGPVQVPRRVLRLGLAFLLIVQACETAMSAWAFTFAVSDLGLSDRTAALFPVAFYLAFTGMRFVSLFASAYLPPSTILQAATATLLVGATLLRSTASAAALARAEGGGGVAVWPVLGSVALVGAGACPLYAMTLASMRRHGELTPTELGWYQTASALGNTAGLWLPGIVKLPVAEQLWAASAFLMLTASQRDFPWRVPKLPLVEKQAPDGDHGTELVDDSFSGA